MSVRLKRLTADYDKMTTVFTDKSRIRIVKTLGRPPEKYQIEFFVTSLQQNPTTQKLKTHNSFMAEIVLTGGYPRLSPQCRMLTPVFHPNIAPHAICIGDHWAAGESLPHLVVRIAEMLAYQSYNLKSPLNGEAARWAEKSKSQLPLDTYDFTSLLEAGEAVGTHADGSRKAGGRCANCGKTGDSLRVCANNHVACPECLVSCPICQRELCLKCTRETCVVCGQTVCQNCIVRCASCGRLACLKHTGRCHICGQPQCDHCLVPCQSCGKSACIDHITKVVVQGKKAYFCTECATAAAGRRQS